MRTVTILISLTALGMVQEQPAPKTAAEVDPVCKKADEALDESLRLADEVAMKSKREAAATRYRIYKAQLIAATKAGDFDRATAIKAGIEKIEADPDGYRPKPKDIVRFEGHSFALIRDAVTWHVAKLRCEQMGGHMAILESPKEVAFIAGLLRKSGQSAWVGATDEVDEGKWKWINGKLVTVPISADNGYKAEHHLLLTQSELTDRLSGEKWYFVCEWDN